MYMCIFALSPICFCFSSCTVHCSSSAGCIIIIRWFFFSYSSSNFAPWFLGVLLLWISTNRERVMDSLPHPASLTVRLRINGYQKQNASFFFSFVRSFVRFFSFPMSIRLPPTCCKVGTSGNASRRSL